MADEKVLGLEVPAKVVNSYKELTKEIKLAQSAQVSALKTFGEGSEQYKKATLQVGKLKDELDDVNHSARTMSGDGMNRASAGLSSLGEGMRTLDFDKVKAGFAAMKSAMAATGIMLIVQGVMYLIENFDELSKGSGLLAKALRVVGDVIQGAVDILYTFTDLIGLTNSELDKQGEAIAEYATKSNEALASTQKEYDNLMKVAKAEGKSTVEIEKAKQQAIIDTNKLILEQIVAFVRAGGELDEEKKKMFNASIQFIKDAKVEEKVIDINHNKEVNANYKKHLDEKKKLYEQAFDEEFNNATRNALQDAQIASDIKKFKAAEEEKARIKLETSAATHAKLEEEFMASFEKDVAASEAASKKKSEGEVAAANAGLEAAKISADSQAQLSNFLFDLKRGNMKKGSAEELKMAKRQFQINKALAIQSSIISGIQGVINALSAQSVIPEPYGTILKVATAVGVGIAATVNTAKIASQQFNEGGGGGGDAAASTSVGSTATAAPPTIATPQNTPPSTTTFDDKGKNTSLVIKAEVVETESTATQKQVEKFNNQATF